MVCPVPETPVSETTRSPGSAPQSAPEPPTAAQASAAVIVRDARPGELAELGDLRVAAYEAGGFLSDASHYGETLRTLGHDGTGQILAAVEEDGGSTGAGGTGRILGTVMLQLWPDAGHVVRGPGDAEVRALAVAPEARGRGVGRALLRAVTDQARACGVRQPGAVHPGDDARRAAPLHRGRVPPDAGARLGAGTGIHPDGLRLGAAVLIWPAGRLV